MKTAIYPGSFDPITNGHLDIINRGLKIFDKVIVGVLLNSSKKPLFSVSERIEMIKSSIQSNRLEVNSFDGLLVDYVEKTGADAILRGIRAISDFEYEFQMALMNRKLLKTVDTVFMMPDEKYSYLSSKLVREVAKFNGNIEPFVPKIVIEKLKEKFSTNN